ncbi:MAG: sulfite exporter TauE/SafE family protein, partial [Chitinophagaceae bacterium]
MTELFVNSALNWTLVLIDAFIVGLSKSGIKGIDMLNVTIMTLVFGSKASTGIVLPLLCIADIMAVRYYHRHADWTQFWKLLPWMAVGILIGVVVGKDLNEAVFRKLMAAIILITVAIVVIMEFRKTLFVPHNIGFVSTMGLTAGFTTMLGNLAGAFSNLYFLALRMPKNGFIGTTAWLFLVINLFKLPFQVFVWKNISLATLKVDLVLLPAMVIGFFLGIKVVGRIKDENYRRVVIFLTLCGALMIFF